jgi:hypothetical protein
MASALLGKDVMGLIIQYTPELNWFRMSHELKELATHVLKPRQDEIIYLLHGDPDWMLKFCRLWHYPGIHGHYDFFRVMNYCLVYQRLDGVLVMLGDTTVPIEESYLRHIRDWVLRVRFKPGEEVQPTLVQFLYKLMEHPRFDYFQQPETISHMQRYMSDYLCPFMLRHLLVQYNNHVWDLCFEVALNHYDRYLLEELLDNVPSHYRLEGRHKCMLREVYDQRREVIKDHHHYVIQQLLQ